MTEKQKLEQVYKLLKKMHKDAGIASICAVDRWIIAKMIVELSKDW